MIGLLILISTPESASLTHIAVRGLIGLIAMYTEFKLRRWL